jgi:hypothetical protein
MLGPALLINLLGGHITIVVHTQRILQSWDLKWNFSEVARANLGEPAKIGAAVLIRAPKKKRSSSEKDDQAWTAGLAAIGGLRRRQR